MIFFFNSINDELVCEDFFFFFFDKKVCDDFSRKNWTLSNTFYSIKPWCPNLKLKSNITSIHWMFFFELNYSLKVSSIHRMLWYVSWKKGILKPYKISTFLNKINRIEYHMYLINFSSHKSRVCLMLLHGFQLLL